MTENLSCRCTDLEVNAKPPDMAFFLAYESGQPQRLPTLEVSLQRLLGGSFARERWLERGDDRRRLTARGNTWPENASGSSLPTIGANSSSC